MAKFGTKSLQKLSECEEFLQILAKEVIKYIDFTIYEGHRPVELQQKYFKEGKSKIDGINKKGKHNYFPSKAFDCWTYPINWKDLKSQEKLYEIMLDCERRLKAEGKLPKNKRLRWGGDWNMTGKPDPTLKFKDYPHFEVVDL